MNILYLHGNRFDYLQDLVYSGLVKLLGAKQVYPYPFNKSYFFNFKEYPRNLGFQVGTLSAYLKNRIGSFPYDVVMVAAAKKTAFENYLRLLPRIPSHCPVIFLDGGDLPEIGGDLARKGFPELYQECVQKRPFDLIFKREMLISREYPEKVYPCPFAFNMDRIKGTATNLKESYQVSFWAGETHPDRSVVFDLVKGRYDCDQNGTSKGNSLASFKRKGRHYFEELRRCKISLNVRGNGWDTLRFWELPALGTFMLSQKLDLRIPNPFSEGENIAYFEKDGSDLIDKINYYLEHQAERLQIAEAAHQHLLHYHTDEARARYILKVISETVL